MPLLPLSKKKIGGVLKIGEEWARVPVAVGFLDVGVETDKRSKVACKWVEQGSVNGIGWNVPGLWSLVGGIEVPPY